MHKSYAYRSLALLAVVAVLATVYAARQTDVETVGTTLFGQFGYTAQCSSDLHGFERGEQYVCADSDSGVWQEAVSVVPTTESSATTWFAAYQAESSAVGHEVLKLTGQRSVNMDTALLAETDVTVGGAADQTVTTYMFVVHGGYLYTLSVNQGRRDSDAFFSSFAFTR